MLSVERTTLEEREEIRLGGRGGFTFLLAAGFTWSLAGASTLLFPVSVAGLVFIFQGLVALPLAFALQKVLGFPFPSKENSLVPLIIQVSMTQSVAVFAAAIVYAHDPFYVPAVLAAIVGGHFLPYIWIHRDKIYGVLAFVLAIVPFAMTEFLGEDSFYYVGFFAGVVLVASAFSLRARIEKDLAA